MFRDAIRRLVARLRDAGVETVAQEEPRMFHAFPVIMPWAHTSQRVLEAVRAFVDARLSPAERRAARPVARARPRARRPRGRIPEPHAPRR
jgi:acetyl esterase/lipase